MNPIGENEGIKVQRAAACHLCGTEGQILYGGLCDRIFGAPGKWDLKKCPHPECGLIWLDPMPTEADIHKVYAVYYTHQAPVGEIANVGVWRILLKKVLRVRKLAYYRLLHLTGIDQARFNVATMYLANNKPGKLLEVGCGNGAFLHRMRSLGWEVQGVEVDPQAAKIAERVLGIPVDAGPLEAAGYPCACFDAVTMNHVIEHVHRPVDLLRECKRVLKPGGHLVVVTPNVKSLGHIRYKRNWRGLEPPRHLHLFFQSTLENSAKKAGFQKIETWTTPANAEVIALGSIHIQFGRHKILANLPSLTRELMSVWFQLRALAYYRKDPSSGEEVVLRASI